MKTIRYLISAIMMMNMILTRRAIAVLDYPADIDNFIIYASSLYKSMIAAPYFGGSAAKLNKLQTDISKLIAAQTGIHTVPPTHTTVNRNAELHNVRNDLRSLRPDVQALAVADPDHARVIIEAAGMKAKREGVKNKQAFVVKHGELSETVIPTAKGIRGRHAHEWAMSLDGTNWIYVAPMLAAKTIVTSLTKGSIMDFRHRYILKRRAH